MTSTARSASLALTTLALAGCAAPGLSTPRTATLASAMPEGAPRAPLAWADFTPATFAKARAERKFIVLDGSAEWCHWCHVMEATTYHDKAVSDLLAASFIAVKVDVDSRPDVLERYGDYGWPATVIFSPDAQELGKYRGYIAPADFATILRDVVSGAATSATPKPRLTALPSKDHLSDDELAWIERSTEVALDDYYDEDEGGWGRTQKVPIGGDNAWALLRASQGDAVMKRRVLFTLDKQRAVMDPVWGGVYQYSIGQDWTHPHFEKLMPYQAGAIENYARAYALTGESRFLEVAQAVRRYVDGFLMSKEGGFYATEDADLNAHDPTRPFLSGHEFYALGDAERRARGVPRVDTHEYGHENGLAIAAYATLYEASCGKARASCDTTALASAERAAARMHATHETPGGGIAHDADPKARVLHLADNAALAYAELRLYEATHDVAHRDAATKLADLVLKDFVDSQSGGFFGSTVDVDAVGVFARRRIPFEDNVTMVRLLTALASQAPETDRPRYAAAAERALSAIARPEEIRGQGRMLGELLLAIEAIKAQRRGAPSAP